MKVILPGCGAGKTRGCNLIGVQKRIAETQHRLTTRVGKLDIKRLSDPTTAVIKGFYLRPEDCADGRGVVVFRKVQLSMGVVDVQHRQIAEDMGLRVENDNQMILDSGAETGFFRLVDRNVWGFLLLPLVLRSSPILRTHDSFLFDERPGYSLQVSDRYVGLARANGMADLTGIEDISQRTAYKFWGQKMYAFMYSATDHIGTVWAVQTLAGLTGPIPFRHVNEFLLVLARHVSPDFTVFRFLPDRQGKEGIDKRRLDIAPYDVKYPSCLRWPEEMMLVKS
jgi:hypothetical protein